MTSFSSSPAEQERSYLRMLLVMLGATTFFEGYDAAIPAVILPDLQRSLGASKAQLGAAIAVVGAGAFGALFLTAAGDRFGRRPLLMGTTLLYALFSGLTATAHSVLVFAAFQFLARVFLISEYATAVTIVAEEFPAGRRGRAMGAMTAAGAMGLVAVVAIYPSLARTSLSWRGLYLIGVLPLLLLAAIRTRLRETQRWVRARAEGVRKARGRIREILSGPYRRQLFQVGGLFGFAHFAILSGLAWWTTYARTERGFSRSEVSGFLLVAYPLGVLGFLAAGRLQDRIGRKRTGTIFILVGMVAGVVLFQVHAPRMILVALVVAVFFGLGINSVLNAVVSELFPTQIRATSVAVARSVFATLGASLGPWTVGLLAGEHAPVGNVGSSVSLALLAFIPAVAFLRSLPETAGRELETIAAAAAIPIPGSYLPEPARSGARTGAGPPERGAAPAVTYPDPAPGPVVSAGPDPPGTEAAAQPEEAAHPEPSEREAQPEEAAAQPEEAPAQPEEAEHPEPSERESQAEEAPQAAPAPEPAPSSDPYLIVYPEYPPTLDQAAAPSGGGDEDAAENAGEDRSPGER